MRRTSLTPADALTGAFALSLAVLGLATQLLGSPLSDRGVIVKLFGVAALSCLAAIVRGKGPRAGSLTALACDFYFVVAVVVIFDNLGPLIRARSPVDRDAWLIAFDRRLLGFDPTVALERFATPFLSDVLTVCYVLYYFHPIVLGGLLWADDRKRAASGVPREFPRFAFTILTVFYVSYAGYFLMPAIGPRYTLPHAGPLPRGAVSRAIDSTLDKLEKNKRDCFPSGHTMVVVTVLIEAARRSRRTFLGFLPFGIGLILATVYGRYHYVADVLAGLVLAFLVAPLARAFVVSQEVKDETVP